MSIEIYDDMIQGTEEWLQARCGLLTASEMKHIVTPTLKIASNDKERAHVYELAAQRITGYVEPCYISDDMLRGMTDEVEAVRIYSENHAQARTVGFITNDKWGFTIGYSPDGVVGNDGLIECKSRRQKFQVQTILDGEVPPEYVIQLQTGLLVSERAWIDFISYCGGMPFYCQRVYPDDAVQAAIIEAETVFHDKLEAVVDRFKLHSASLIPTERKIMEEIYA